ncbi:MAG: acyltransferase [Actinobacteria bacterium]|nr:acyltransferase [Actinomycetota bacterium]
MALLTVHVAMFSGLLGTKALGTPRPPTNFVGAFFVSGMPSFIGVMFVFSALFLYLPFAKAIISGTRRPPQRANLVRRLLRLLPAYYVMYLVVLLTLNRDAIDGVWYVLRPILLLQVYLPSPFVPNLMNGMEITWTVPSMVQWYLALPLIAWASHRFAARGVTPAIRARRLMVPVPIMITIGIGWLFFVKARGWDNRIVFWWPQGFAPTIAIGMALAILLALAQVSPNDTSRMLRAAAAHPNRFWLGALVVYFVNCARPFSVIGMDAIYSVSGLLVTYLMVALFGLLAVLPLISPNTRSHAIKTILGTRPFAFLGRVSYGVYLWHFAVMHFYLQPGSVLSGHAKPLRELYGTCGFWQLEIITVAGTVIIASISHYLLERPLAAWSERYLRDDRRAVAVRAALPPAVPVTLAPGTTVMSLDEASAKAAGTVTDRDAIQANLVDLERSFGHQLLAGAALTGHTKVRWDAAATDLTTLWEISRAYSAVVDEAIQILAGARHPSTSELARITGLLTGPSIVVAGTPAPLAQRHITDNGRQRLAVSTAIQRMNDLFAGIAELVSAAETVWTEATHKLDAIGAELAQARRHAEEFADAALATTLAAADAELQRLRHMVGTDPLTMWQDGRVTATELDRLRQHTTAAVARVQQFARTQDGAPA